MFGALPNAHCNRLHSLADYNHIYLFIADSVCRAEVHVHTTHADMLRANAGLQQHSPG